MIWRPFKRPVIANLSIAGSYPVLCRAVTASPANLPGFAGYYPGCYVRRQNRDKRMALV
ncbi:hypothetical protein [Nitrosomonas aestuarii]|uniref:hypothetical protein n=1 Tax=Nitrosomonas aestuarii TaxID=52441 RepID=UPI001BA54C77|nr:hypothetical protein [Nitrosomonas aestuarii]